MNESELPAENKKPKQHHDKHHRGSAESCKAIRARVHALPEFQGLRRIQKTFLLAYSATFNVQKSAKAAKMSWSMHYHWLRHNPQYKLAYEAVREVVGDILESAVYDAVMNGDDKFVTHQGVITDKYKSKSDILRIFMLKGLRPQYRDNYNLANQIGPVSVNITYPSSLPENTLINQRIEEARVVNDED